MAACALVLAIVTLYLVLVSLEDGRPRWWAVAVLTIGMPILLAAGLCVAAVLRGRPAKDWRDTV
jgi:hypothetical protein